MRKKFNFMMLLAVLFVLVFSCVSVMAASKTKVDKTKVTDKTRMIMVGDSYSRRPLNDPSRTWPEQMQAKLKLSDEAVCFVQKSGYGFSRPERKFISVLSPLTKSKNVNRILIVGGVTNDYYRTYNTIHSDVKAVNSLLRSKYPKAKIYYAAPSWRLDATYHERIKEHKKWYKEFCQECGWYYLDAPENVLVGKPDYFESDAHHPNISGVNQIAKKLYSSITTPEYQIKFSKNGGKGSMSSIVCKYGTKIVLPKCSFTKSGYKFNGWEYNGKTYKAGASVKNLSSQDGSSITLKAVWKKK